MSRTLSQILIDTSAYLDLDASEPTSTELTTRINFANQAVKEAVAGTVVKDMISGFIPFAR